MTKPRVLISDQMDPKAAEIFRERGCDVDVITGKTPAELKEIIGQYDGLAIRSTTKLTKELIEEVARRCKVTPLQVDEVVGYYSMLHRKPQGKYHVQVCTSISCMLVGGEQLYDQAKKRLGVGHKETTADGQFSLATVECMASCGTAPMVVVNGKYLESMDAAKVDALIDANRVRAAE